MHMSPQSSFLDLPGELQDPVRAQVHILPIPYEATVSYGRGTRKGPAAIVAASYEVEIYDAELDAEPGLDWGVHTLPPLHAEWRTSEAMMTATADAAEAVARAGKFLLALGGEHSLSAGVVRGIRRVVPEPLTIVQIDAHADLRDSFRGSRYSHACAMRRILDENPGPLIQIGIRSLSIEEAVFVKENRGRITLWSPDLIRSEDPLDFHRQLRSSLSERKIYLTIDVDGLDPSVVLATGTPEPDGLGWRQACDIIRTVASAGEVVAMDCVELAPRPDLHASDFSVAKLLYKALSYIMAARR
jgi:agmatinase